ncbi:MAG TPA: uroporphyrinogen decarboxylase [Nitrososphaerales archaeon]|nr:uroporphyrinogen decarboxylase [Nitrososphaerales archaeon]
MKNTTFLDACRRGEPEHSPVWFMRQAGRYLPSYRRLKGQQNIMDIVKDPELASDVAVDAVKALGVDAGIIFADIMVPLESIGVKFKIEENVGPVVSHPIHSLEDVTALGNLDSKEDLPYVLGGIRSTVAKLDDAVPLIGFSGAPFTLAAYLIEGGPSRNLEKTKTIIYSRPDVWEALMRKLTDTVKDYLVAQVDCGVSAVQLFDSWVGCLAAEDYARFVSAYTKEIFSSVSGVPRIHFCADSSPLVEEFHATGADVLSVDWRVPLVDVWRRCSEETAVQGNLDPVVASVGGSAMRTRVADILEGARGHKGHIFSLGHGVLQNTNPESLRQVVEMVHSRTRSRR